MLVEKNKNSSGCYDVSLIDGDKVLNLAFGGNLDLYWQLYELNSDTDCKKIDFVITKENFFIWNLFDKLYNDVANYWDNVRDNSLVSQSEEHKSYVDALRRQDECNPQRLFKNGVIEWHHDGNPYDESNILRISRSGDNYVVEMDFNSKDYFMDYGLVRISNSGSRYQPFNGMFMKMFNALQEYDFDYHQVHMEEIFYDQDNPKVLKLTNKKQ